MTRLPIKPGIDGLPTGSIPTDPADFVDWFKNSFIPRWAANADIRNATPGAGVQIGGTSDTPGFVGFEAIAGTSVLGNPTGATGDVQAITAGADGAFLQRSAGALVFGPIVSADSITGAGTPTSPLELVHDAAVPGNSKYYGTDVSGTRGFFALPPAGGATITTLTQAGGASQIYTIPAGAKMVQAIVIGGGGGGGSGSKITGNSGGGGGGGGGGLGITYLSAALLGATVTVTFSNIAGGTGGAAQAVAASNGNPGTAGANANFGGFMIALGGAAGGGGSIAGAAGGAAGSGIYGNGVAGAAGGSGIGTQLTAAPFAPASYVSTGGGGGGSINAGTPQGGGAGGGGSTLVTLVGGTGGTGGAPGGPGSAGNAYAPASGGGGGGASNTVGGAGGAGGAFGGGGGGGGAVANTGANSGAGGNGGAAAIIVIAW